MNSDSEQFCKLLPKVELHAHLNGSLSNKTLQELHQLENKGDVTWDQWDAIIAHGSIRTLQECFQMFSVAHSLTSSPAALFKATREVIHEFSEDGVVYLELRSTPRQVSRTMTKTQYIQAIIDAILECRQNVNIIVKLVVSIDRRQGQKEAKDTLDMVVKVNQMYPDIVVGLDLSGDPSQGDFMEFSSVLTEARHYGLRLSIHCAEIPKPSEVKAILEFKPERIGHGTCIHPQLGGSSELWEILLQSKIPVEACLTSNVKSNTVKHYEDHHFQFMFKHQHPITLGTDDKGVFATSLSKEFQIAANTFSLSKQQMWKLSFDSVDYIFGTQQEQIHLKKVLKSWKDENIHLFEIVNNIH